MAKKSLKGQGREPAFFKIVPSAIFGLTGVFYLAAPYDLIASVGLSFGAGEADKPILAGIMLGAAALVWFLRNKAKKARK